MTLFFCRKDAGSSGDGSDLLHSLSSLRPPLWFPPYLPQRALKKSSLFIFSFAGTYLGPNNPLRFGVPLPSFVGPVLAPFFPFFFASIRRPQVLKHISVSPLFLQRSLPLQVLGVSVPPPKLAGPKAPFTCPLSPFTPFQKPIYRSSDSPFLSTRIFVDVHFPRLQCLRRILSCETELCCAYTILSPPVLGFLPPAFLCCFDELSVSFPLFPSLSSPPYYGGC